MKVKARNRSSLATLAIAFYAVSAQGLLAVEPAKDASDAAAPSASDSAKAAASVPLDKEQDKLAKQYSELEKAMNRMAEVVGANDPKQAALLRQAFAESRQRLLDDRFVELVKQLNKDQLYVATKGQVQVEQDLVKLLELLQSGDRAKQAESEKEQYKKIIAQLDKLIKEVEGTHGQTEGEGDTKELAPRQGKQADKAKQLAQDIKKLEPKETSASDENKPDDKSKGEGKGQGQGKGEEKSGGKGEGKGDGKGESDGKSDKKSADGKQPGDIKSPGDGNKSPSKLEEKGQGKGDGKGQGKGDGKSDGKSDGKGEGKSEGKGEGRGEGKGQGKGQGQGQEGQGQGDGHDEDNQPNQGQSDDQSPARKRIEAAENKMRQAQKQLEEANRKGAADEQQKALDDLKAAKLELEKILRQMREEQIERVLAMLEGRFRKMLVEQIEVYEGTVRLDKVPDADRSHDDEIEASRLSRKESGIVLEADKALNLLHEEGSAVAFPESVEQMRDDMQQVAARLARAKVEQVTQGIEEDVIKQLEETIAALQKAQKDQKSGKPRPGQAQGQPQEPPLVDKIAELKMIRALQMRVNSRTKRYSKMLEGDVEETDRPDLVEALKRLAEREERIHQVTRDIVVGKNR